MFRRHDDAGGAAYNHSALSMRRFALLPSTTCAGPSPRSKSGGGAGHLQQRLNQCTDGLSDPRKVRGGERRGGLEVARAMCR